MPLLNTLSRTWVVTKTSSAAGSMGSNDAWRHSTSRCTELMNLEVGGWKLIGANEADHCAFEKLYGVDSAPLPLSPVLPCTCF